MSSTAEGRALRAEQRRLDAEIAARKAALADALRAGADTAGLRAELRTAEQRRDEIGRRLSELAAAVQAKAAHRAQHQARELADSIVNDLAARLAALQPPPHPIHGGI